MLLTDLLPAKVRKIVYSVLFTVNAVLVALLAAGYEVVGPKPMAAFVGVASALGFALSAGNTDTSEADVEA